jgi:hypothetical protein
VYRRTRADVVRLGSVLAGLSWPAAKAQIVVHADGADPVSTAQLWSLPPRTVYADLADVCQALGVLPNRMPQAR